MKHSEKRGNIYTSAYAFCGTFLGVMLCLFTLLVFAGRTATVSGSSMEPNLSDGDRLLIRTAWGTPDYGDIIAVGRNDEQNPAFIKRVVARGGDVVDINYETHLITVNGGVVTEHYKVLDALTVQGDVSFPVKVPENCVFVLGDNRNDSLDSRFSEIGFIRLNEIAGVAVCRIYPFGKTAIR
ncbi:MAG: signal peptidase I [Clostridia bacterium]|nr:signal peptidase I [Clostridia bacterium]